MEVKRWRPLSTWLALFIALGALWPANADEKAKPMEWGVTATGYRTFVGEMRSHHATTGLTWCGEDVLIFISGRIWENMFTGGDLIWVNVEIGAQKTLRPSIFKFIPEVFNDEPVEGWGDTSGIFEIWPLACSPDGEWLFYRYESYEGLVSFYDRHYELRALHLATGRDRLLFQTETEIISVTPAPDGRKLLVDFRQYDATGQQSTTRSELGEWTVGSSAWEPVELSGEYRYVGWNSDSGMLVAVANTEFQFNKFRSGFLEVSEAEMKFLPLVMPTLYREWVETAGPRAGHIRIKDVRKNRIVGYYEVPESDGRSYRTIFFSCGIDGQAWKCMESEPFKVGRSYFIWSHDGESVFYEGRLRKDSEGNAPGGIIRHDLATGEDIFIASASIMGDLSPDGKKLLMRVGFGYPKILFLEPSPQ